MTSRWSLRYSDGAAKDRAASRRRILMETICRGISVAAAVGVPLCWSRSLFVSSDGGARPSKPLLTVGGNESRSEDVMSLPWIQVHGRETGAREDHRDLDIETFERSWGTGKVQAPRQMLNLLDVADELVHVNEAGQRGRSGYLKQWTASDVFVLLTQEG
jgi:hypothetical protein